MLDFIRLLLFFLWGMVLAFFYRFFTTVAWRGQGRTIYVAVVAILGGALLLAATLFFALVVSAGAIGLYSLPALLVGFYLYLRFLSRPLERFLLPLYRGLRTIGRTILRLIRHIIIWLFWPLAKIVTAIEYLCHALLSPWQKHRQKRLRRKHRRRRHASFTAGDELQRKMDHE